MTNIKLGDKVRALFNEGTNKKIETIAVGTVAAFDDDTITIQGEGMFYPVGEPNNQVTLNINKVNELVSFDKDGNKVDHTPKRGHNTRRTTKKNKPMANNTTNTSKKRVSNQSIFDRYETEDAVTLTLGNDFGLKRENVNAQPRRMTTIEHVPNSNMVRMPRSKGDRRCREWTAEEREFVIEHYAKGKSRNAIARMLGVSHAPLVRLLYRKGLLKPAHAQAAKRAGHI